MTETNEAKREALLLKGVGGLYTAVTDDGVLHECRARGIFRHQGTKPLIGDRVRIQTDADGVCAICDILPRHSALIRPPMANLDILFVVAAAARPDPFPLLIDKLMLSAERQNIEPVLIITKGDLNEAQASRLCADYRRCGFEAFCTAMDSQGNLSGVELLRARVLTLCRGRLAAFSGVSGAGKSTLLNALFPQLMLETGALSQRIGRGKNTTRSVELFPLWEREESALQRGYLADTPGFSLLEFSRLADCSKEELPGLFREFSSYLGQCRYTKCSHTKEQDCAVRSAVAKGEIPVGRHESYCTLYEELKDRHEWNHTPH